MAYSRTGLSYSGGGLDYGSVRHRLEAGDRRRVGSGFENGFEVAVAVRITPGIMRNPGSLTGEPAPRHDVVLAIFNLSFRPSQNVLQGGWVNPTIAK